MIIKETNDPKTLKHYIRYVVEKYHDLAKKYVDLKDIIVTITTENQCLKIENSEYRERIESYVNEIKNLYSMLSDKKFVDNMCENVLELNQLNLFYEEDENKLPIIEFNELVDNENNIISNNKDTKKTYDNRF
jgi:regulator of replication initiation timing